MSGVGSRDKTEDKNMYCSDCKLYYNKRDMYEYPCECCLARKCFEHKPIFDCNLCNVIGLCDDCSTFLLCCGDVNRWTNEKNR